MKIFQTVQKNFGILGICRDQPRFNGKSLIACLIYGLGTILSAIFLICEADTFNEYTNNLYITTALAVGLFCLTNIILKMKELFALADKIEKSLDESKCDSRFASFRIADHCHCIIMESNKQISESENPTSKAIYKGSNRLVEKLSRIVHFAIAIVSPVCMVLPKAVASYLIYFFTNLGNEAFELPLFYW